MGRYIKKAMPNFSEHDEDDQEQPILRSNTKGTKKAKMSSKKLKTSVEKKVEKKLKIAKEKTFQKRLPKKNSTPRSSTSLSFLQNIKK